MSYVVLTLNFIIKQMNRQSQLFINFQWEKTLEILGEAKSSDHWIQMYGKTLKLKKYENNKDCVVAKRKWNEIEFKGKTCSENKYFMCKTGNTGTFKQGGRQEFDIGVSYINK